MSKNIYDPACQYGLYGLLEGTDRQSNGNTFFVDSSCGSNSAGGTWGRSWETPYATVNYAVSKCTTGAGDVILVAAAHAETITATSSASGSSTGQFCIDKGDVSIIGMGRGTKRPKFSFTTAAAAGVKLVGTAPNVLLSNLVFKTYYTGGTTEVIAAAANCYGLTVENCMFYETANTQEALVAIGLASAIEDVTIRGCKFHNIDGGDSTAAIKTAGTAPRLKIYDNWFRGDWAASVLDLDAGHVYDVDIHDNVINNVDAGLGLVITLSSSGTGMIYDNVIHTAVQTDIPIAAAACLIGKNDITWAEGLTGGLANLAPSCGVAAKSYSTFTAAAHNLFDVIGGPVNITGFYGVVTTDIKDASIDISIKHTTTSPAGSVELASDLICDDDAAGTVYNLPATLGAALEVVTAGTHAHIEADFIAPIGTLSFTLEDAADDEGAITWYCRWESLAPGAYVRPATTS